MCWGVTSVCVQCAIHGVYECAEVWHLCVYSVPFMERTSVLRCDICVHCVPFTERTSVLRCDTCVCIVCHSWSVWVLRCDSCVCTVCRSWSVRVCWGVTLVCVQCAVHGVYECAEVWHLCVYSVPFMERSSVPVQYTYMRCLCFQARKASGWKQRTLRKTTEQGNDSDHRTCSSSSILLIVRCRWLVGRWSVGRSDVLITACIATWCWSWPRPVPHCVVSWFGNPSQ